MSTYRQSREQIYLAAQAGRPAWESYNRRVSELLQAYNFKVFLPQEATLSHPFERGELEMPLDHSKMMIAVFHDTAPCERMAYEIGEAYRRALPIFGLSSMDPMTLPPDLIFGFIKILPLPDNDDELLHPLMTTINRWYPV